MTDAVVAALGLRSLATAGGVGEGGEGPVPAPPLEARDRGDFYSDTASARLCLVMVTCARSAPPSAAPPLPRRSDGGIGAWATEAEPERGHGGAPECQWWCCPLSPGNPCSRNPGLAGLGPVPDFCP